MPELSTIPWISMWVAPRKTIQKIAQRQEKPLFFFLSSFYGWPITLQIAQNNNLSEALPFWGVLGLTLVVAPFVGMLAFYIASGLLYWTGKWLGAVGSFYSIRSAVSWANITSVVSVLTWMVIVFVFKDSTFCSNFIQMPMSIALARVLMGVFALQLVVSVWTICLFVASIAEVQGFSVGRALINIVAAVAVAFVALWVASFLIGAVVGINL